MAHFVSLVTILVCSFVLYVSDAATHNHNHALISGDIRFSYDPDLHHLVAITTSKCFMVTLTHDERDHVHTTVGLEDLELKMMREWLGTLPEIKIYHDDTHLPTHIQKWCATKDIFLLERQISGMTSPQPALASASTKPY